MAEVVGPILKRTKKTNRLYDKCRYCGLIIIGQMSIVTYSDHSWECEAMDHIRHEIFNN